MNQVMMWLCSLALSFTLTLPYVKDVAVAKLGLHLSLIDNCGHVTAFCFYQLCAKMTKTQKEQKKTKQRWKHLICAAEDGCLLKLLREIRVKRKLKHHHPLFCGDALIPMMLH